MKYWVLLLYALAGANLTWARSQELPRATQPLVFEPNRGQAPAEAKWIGHGPGYELIFTNDDMKMVVADKSTPSPRVRKCTAIQLKLDGGRLWNSVSGLEPTGGVSNYLHGPDAKPLTGIPHYARLRVAEVYEGIDLIFYNNAGNLEYDFELHPGADPRKIRFSFEGQSDLRLDHKSGDLVLTTQGGYQLRLVPERRKRNVASQRSRARLVERDVEL